MATKRYKPLSNREIEILRLIAEELTSAQIAARKGLSIRTVETYRKRINRKTGISNPIGLFKYAVKNGFVKGFFTTEIELNSSI